MDIATFIEQRRPTWRQLEEMLELVQGSGLPGLSEEQAVQFGQLYRRTASDLNQAQTLVSGDEVVQYLNHLVARCYVVIYGSGKRHRWMELVRGAFYGYAEVLRRNMGYLLATTLLFFAGGFVGFILAVHDPYFKEYVVPAEFGHIEPEREEMQMTPGEVTAFSGHLFANNVRVSLLAFALGLTLGIGTCWMMFYNGLLMGVIGKIFWDAGQMRMFCAQILPHGVLELPAIFIGGAAGLLLARSLIVARPWSRLDDLTQTGVEAVKLALGVVPLLAAAAVLEAGVARAPSWLLGDWLKLTIAGIVGLTFVLYIGFVVRPRWRPAGRKA